MGYKDNFEAACPLDSLSWVSMEPRARICRIANRFLKEEDKLKNLKEKGDWAVTAGVVKPWLLSFYEPPRGQTASLITSVMVEIGRQRDIRTKRAKNPRWEWEALGTDTRRNRVSMGLYGVLVKEYGQSEKLTREQNVCSTLTTISGILMALDVQSEANIRVYMRHRESGRVKVVILDTRANYNGVEVWPFTKVLLLMAPKAVERAIFSGARLAVDFERNGFTLDGVFHPWNHVVKIVEGPKRAMRTRKRVVKKSEPDDDEE